MENLYLIRGGILEACHCSDTGLLYSASFPCISNHHSSAQMLSLLSLGQYYIQYLLSQRFGSRKICIKVFSIKFRSCSNNNFRPRSIFHQLCKNTELHRPLGIEHIEFHQPTIPRPMVLWRSSTPQFNLAC